MAAAGLSGHDAPGRTVTSYLAERMTKLAARLREEGPAASVNELGEVQGLGADVDRLCALLHAARGSRDLARRIAGAGAEDR